MGAWHQTWKADVGLRVCGLALCAIAYLAIRRLVASPPGPRRAGLLDYGLAAIGFVSASGGSATALLGRHLFDRVEISERWRRRDDVMRRPDRHDITKRER